MIFNGTRYTIAAYSVEKKTNDSHVKLFSGKFGIIVNMCKIMATAIMRYTDNSKSVIACEP